MVARKILRLWREKYRGPWWFAYAAGLLLAILFAGTLYYFFAQTRTDSKAAETAEIKKVDGGLLTQSCTELETIDF